MKKLAGSIIGIVTIIVMIGGYILTSTQNTEKLAKIQMTKMAAASNSIPAEAWQPITLDLAKAAEYGLTVEESTNSVPDGLFYFHSDETQWTIFLWREYMTDSVSLTPNLETGLYFSGIACGMAYSLPESLTLKKFLDPNDESQFFYSYRSYGEMLTQRRWKISGGESNIREFIVYTEYGLRNNPLCQLVGTNPDVTQYPQKEKYSEPVYPWSNPPYEVIN